MRGKAVNERNKANAKAAYDRRRAAGLCVKCGAGDLPVHGFTCLACRHKQAERNKKRDQRSDICARCQKVSPENGRSCCRSCLDDQKLRNRRQRGTNFGRWVSTVRKMTANTANRKKSAPVFLGWSSQEFADRFPEHKLSGKDLDHIIPLACALGEDGDVDEEFGRLVVRLENLQLLAHSENVLKAANKDRQAINRAKELRLNGITGAALFHALWAEFAWPHR